MKTLINKFKNLADWEAIKKFFHDLKSFLFAESIEGAEYSIKELIQLENQVRSPIIFGFISMGVALGFFVVWGGLAPLDSAAIAGGSIMLSQDRKIIQHSGGGIVDKILVKEGEFVNEGQELMVLNASEARAHVYITLSALRMNFVVEKRLIAEIYDLHTVDFNDPLLDPDSLEVQALIKNQTALFETRRQSLQGAIGVLNQQLQQELEMIGGQEVQLKSKDAQLVLAKDQLAAVKALLDKGLTTKSSLRDAQNRVEAFNGEIGAYRADVAGRKQKIEEIKLKIADVRNRYQVEIAEQYRDIHAKVLELEERHTAAKEVLDRTIIRAPKSGIITGLKVHTIGAVIGSGQPIMDIIPQDDDLIVEAMIDPKDIDSVRVGNEVKVQLGAYKQKLVPRISGEVIYVSADKILQQLPDGRQMGSYMAKIKLDQAALNRLNTDIQLQPGMPATVFIVKGTRTFLQYLMSPIIDSFHRAFKEV